MLTSRPHSVATALLLLLVANEVSWFVSAQTDDDSSAALHWEPRGSASTLEPIAPAAEASTPPSGTGSSKKSKSLSSSISSIISALRGRDDALQRIPLLMPQPAAPANGNETGQGDLTGLVQTIAELKGISLTPPAPPQPRPTLIGNSLDMLRGKFYESKLGARFAPSPPPPVKYDYNDLVKVLFVAKKRHLFPSKYKPSPPPPPAPMGLDKGVFKTMLEAPNQVNSKFNFSVPDYNLDLRIFKGFPDKVTTEKVNVRLPGILALLALLLGGKKKPPMLPKKLPLPMMPMPGAGMPGGLNGGKDMMSKLALLQDQPSLWTDEMGAGLLKGKLKTLG